MLSFLSLTTQPVIMSSIADAITRSDRPGLKATTTWKELSKPASGRDKTPRLQGPPSESNGHLSDTEEYPDDEVVGSRITERNRRGPMDRAIPPVTDQVGERVADVFGDFLEKYAGPFGHMCCFLLKPIIASVNSLPLLVFPLRVLP